MERFELAVSPESFELRCPDEPKELKFPTLLSAFAYAQLSMFGDNAELVVTRDDGFEEHLPLYRMTA